MNSKGSSMATTRKHPTEPPTPTAEPIFRHTLTTGVAALLQGIQHDSDVAPEDIVTLQVRVTGGSIVVAAKNRSVRVLTFPIPESNEEG